MYAVMICSCTWLLLLELSIQSCLNYLICFYSQDLESDRLQDHLSLLAESLNKTRMMIYPPGEKASKLGEDLNGSSDIVNKENKILLARKSLIEKRKAEHERQMIEMILLISFIWSITNSVISVWNFFFFHISKSLFKQCFVSR